MITEVTTDNIDDILATRDRPVALEFWATWCGSCRSYSPILDRLDEQYGDRIRIAKANVDDMEELAERFEVMTIPTLLIFRDGEKKEALGGTRGFAKLTEDLKAYLGEPAQ